VSDQNELASDEAEVEKIVEPQAVIPSQNGNADKTLYELKSDLAVLSSTVQGIADSAAKTSKEIYELHKLYHNEYAKRLTAMQEELERYREIEKGRAFDGILTEIARLYSDNAFAVDDIADEKMRKRFRYMFLDMLQVLENNGVFKQESKQGDKRNTRHCQVTERVPTADPNLHDTVAESLNVGFYIENRTLIKEMVRVFVCENKSEDKEGHKEE